MGMTKSETVEKLMQYRNGERIKTSRGELSYEDLRDEIRRGESYVVRTKDADDKKQDRALTVTTQGHIVYNDTQQEFRNGFEAERIDEDFVPEGVKQSKESKEHVSEVKKQNEISENIRHK